MIRDVKNNARLVALHTLLLNTMFFVPILVPYFRDVIGVDYQGFMVCQALFSATVILMDVPTGLVADLWTRRTTMIVGTAIYALGELALIPARGFWQAAAAEMLIGVAVSLLSGAKMALLYDSMVEAEQETAYRRQQGFVHGIGLYATGFAALGGGWLYALDPRLPVYLTAGMAVLATLSSLLIAEPVRHKRTVHKHPLADMMETMRYALHGHREIARLILLSSAIFSATRLMWWAQQPFDEMLHMPVTWFGIVAGVYFLCSGAGGHWGHLLDRKLSDNGAMGVCLAAVFVSCLGAGLWPGYATLPLLLTGGVIFGVGMPRLQTAINRQVDSARRATILSTANFMLSVISIPLLAAAGALESRYGIAASLLMTAGFTGVTGVIALLLPAERSVSAAK